VQLEDDDSINWNSMSLDADAPLGDISEGSHSSGSSHHRHRHNANETSPVSSSSHDDASPRAHEKEKTAHESAAPVNPTTDSVSAPRPNLARPGSVRASASVTRPAMARRNTCGTLYVGSTLSAPDKDGSIKVSHKFMYALCCKL
jgi:hypothetical protein